MQNNNNTKKVCTITYGCQMSERDAETLTTISESKGFVRTDLPELADLIIINTCCVRESAENKIMGKIGQLKKLKEKKPSLKIAVAGCMVQQPGLVEKLQKKAPHIDIWTGTFDHHQFEKLLDFVDEGGKTAVVSEEACVTTEVAPLAEKGKMRTNVNIMYGCDNYCAYCIVPYVRGSERSRPMDVILDEIKVLVENGCRDVTLLGQNVNSYGKKDGFAYDFSDLLTAIDRIDGLYRIRFMTSHPKDLSDKLIDTVAQGEHICEHFHLPFQAGSNNILKTMNRGYTREYYLERIDRIREKIPEARLTTDIIVGFPGETEEDFEQTLDIVARVPYTQAFTFMFSKRSGTVGATLPDQVPLDTKKSRLQKLMGLQNTRSLEWRQKMLQGRYEILVEGPSKSDPEFLTGRTRGNEIVVFKGEENLIGKLMTVTITSANSWTLFGEA
ncbi:tRNA (N6-isopentenyl adenosine(37)-C2)-methylthiotransferase MiaB [Dehalobacter sp. DCM]|uniref:tRNA (N6-isopentenyl adenosine(37)-C2)-methylthiotransferase MiaB n=1 Tax=Dehalobacter sp. DCM TaxID=2907827 RepID=UPI003081E36D|nr:tRNA (N6-isopentenyl adenosine(37)-C2)-methylthiotransferase MiaB [Dehalobacter sp. DCM]